MHLNDAAANAATSGDTLKLSELIAQGVDPNSINAAGSRLLVNAAQNGRLDCVVGLLRMCRYGSYRVTFVL